MHEVIRDSPTTRFRNPRLAVASVLLLLGLVTWAALTLGLHRHVRVRAVGAWNHIKEPPLSPTQLGDRRVATALLLADPMGLALGPNGDLYVSDRGRRLRGRVIWRIDREGRAHAIAGTGRRGTPTPGKPAASTTLDTPAGLAFDAAGRLHFADEGSNQVYRIEADGKLAVVAGSGVLGVGGDGGRAEEALLNKPTDIAFGHRGELYIADVGNHRIRRVTPDGSIETIAGSGEPGYDGDGGAATMARLREPWGIHVDPGSGDLLIADGANHVIRRVDREGVITTLAGTGFPGFSRDSADALDARFDTPQSLATTAAGTLLIGDEHNHAIRELGAQGLVRTLLGTGGPGFAANGSRAPAAHLNDPERVVVAQDGSIYVTDGDNGRVLRLDRHGVISNVAGRPRLGEYRIQPPSQPAVKADTADRLRADRQAP